MTTPNKQEILDRAIKLFHQDNDFAITPEEEELKESGYFTDAQCELMQGEDSEALSYLEQQANEIGYRLIPEKQQTDIVYYKTQVANLKRKLKQVKTRYRPFMKEAKRDWTPDPSRVRIWASKQEATIKPVKPQSSQVSECKLEDKLEICIFENKFCRYLCNGKYCGNPVPLGCNLKLKNRVETFKREVKR